MTTLVNQNFCSMCGSMEGDFWQTNPNQGVALSIKPRAGDLLQSWMICDECNEGLQNAAPQKPDRILLLSQIRRATIDDQQAVLEWLLKKFNLTAQK